MDITKLTPEELGALKAQLAQTDPTGRSPFRPRQLHDLRLLPTAKDPRPTFFWSAESPRDAGDLTRTTEFPKLMWHVSTGEEITVYNLEQQEAKASFYTVQPPMNAVAVEVDPIEAMREALDRLTPEERAVIIQAQQDTRRAALTAKLSALSEEQLEALLSGETAAPTRNKGGRPRKESAA
jgi:hypothetical protein